MSEIKIDNTEKDDCTEMIMFLENLSPELKEKFKTIMWWESLKAKEQIEQSSPPENASA